MSLKFTDSAADTQTLLSWHTEEAVFAPVVV